MVHHSMSRSQRANGSKAKRAVQVTMVLVVVVWLLYRTSHSYDKKTEVAENFHNTLPTAVVNKNLGRKVDAGSEIENITDVHRDNSHETTEMKENGVDGDAWNREETIEVENGNEESQRGITNGNVEVNTEDAHESLRLPGQMESDSLDHNEIKNDGEEGATENGEADSTTSSETVEGSEHDETGGENSEVAEPVTEESTDASVSADQQNAFISEGKTPNHEGETIDQNASVSADQQNAFTSEDKNANHEGETIEAQEHTQSDTENASGNREEDAATNARSDAEVVNENVNLPNSTDENNVASEDSQKEVGSQMGNNSRDSTSAEVNLKDGNSNSVMQEGNGSPRRG